ncbi:SRPBCC family protein, partial [Mycobacterium sp. E342]|uniref:SRPBCC family protein n=1 Tax=Mycobacterium sp. E342 TaxID=1834147 RepID=UPI001E51134E
MWKLVSDVRQIGRFSPETIRAEWLEGATGPHPGAKFRGRVKHNEKGPICWTSCMITQCEPYRVFAFSVRSQPTGLPDRSQEHLSASHGATRSHPTVLERWSPRRRWRGIRRPSRASGYSLHGGPDIRHPSYRRLGNIGLDPRQRLLGDQRSSTVGCERVAPCEAD